MTPDHALVPLGSRMTPCEFDCERNGGLHACMCPERGGRDHRHPVPLGCRTQVRYGTRGEILIRAYMDDYITTEEFEMCVDGLMRLGAWDQQCPSMFDWTYQLPI